MWEVWHHLCLCLYVHKPSLEERHELANVVPLRRELGRGQRMLHHMPFEQSEVYTYFKNNETKHTIRFSINEPPPSSPRG